MTDSSADSLQDQSLRNARLPAALGLRAPSGPFRAGPPRCRNIRRFRRNTITIIKRKKKEVPRGPASAAARLRAAGPRLWGAFATPLPDQRRSSRPSGIQVRNNQPRLPGLTGAAASPGFSGSRLPTLPGQAMLPHVFLSGAALLHAAKAPRPRLPAYLGSMGWVGRTSCGLQGGGFLSPLTLYPRGSCNA